MSCTASSVGENLSINLSYINFSPSERLAGGGGWGLVENLRSARDAASPLVRVNMVVWTEVLIISERCGCVKYLRLASLKFKQLW